MAINIHCPHCSATIRIHAKHIGKPGRCPKCRKTLMIRAPHGSDDELPSAAKLKRKGYDSEVDFDVEERPDSSFDDALGESREFHISEREPPSAIQRRNRPPVRKNKNAGVILGFSIGGVVLLAVIVFGLTWLANKPGSTGSTQSVVEDGSADEKTPRDTDGSSVPAAKHDHRAPVEDSSKANVAKVEPAAGLAPVRKSIIPVTGTPQTNSVGGSNQVAVAPTKPVAPAAFPATAAPVATNAPTAAAPAPTSFEQLLEKAVNGVVLVNVLDDTGKKLGHGSGFLLNRSGLIATNFHVIEPASKATVRFHNGTECQVLGARAWDDKRDLALIQIENPPADATTLELGPAEPPRQGAEIIAIGHPRGLEFTATKGIVNAVHRSDQLPEDMRAFLKAPGDQIWIQMSALIDRGSSGGPLLNSAGQVVGINTWVMTDVNFGFASHIQHLMGLMSQVKSDSQTKALAEIGKRKKRAWGGGFAKLDEGLAQIVNEYKRKHEEFLVEVEQAPSMKAREALVKSKNPAASYSNKLLAFAKSAPSKPVAFQALYFTLLVAGNVSPETRAQKTVKEATDLVLANHLEEQGLQPLVIAVSEIRLPEIRNFLQQVSEKSTQKDVQGTACFGLARYLMASPNLSDSAEAQLLTLLERIQNDFADVSINDTPLGDIVEPLIFERKNLGIGKEAPEIIGKDSSGEDLHLSDFRGKVVVLDFFGNWCPYCAQMFPHERVLVEELANGPFAIVGVNSDPLDQLRELESKKNITWKSFADGPGGPIATRWNIHSFPTLYLIDQQGIIRQKFEGYVDAATLNNAVRKLLNKSGGDSSRKSTKSPPKEKESKGLTGKKRRIK